MAELLWAFICAYLLTASLWLVLGWDQDEPQEEDDR